MTNQMQGEILFAGWDGANDGNWVYTPWMPVRGNYAMFGVEVLSMAGSLTLTWEVQTRTAEDPTTTDSIITGQTISGPGIGQFLNETNDPCLQLVRYRFMLPGSGTTNFVIIRALMPSWKTDR